MAPNENSDTEDPRITTLKSGAAGAFEGIAEKSVGTKDPTSHFSKSIVLDLKGQDRQDYDIALAMVEPISKCAVKLVLEDPSLSPEAAWKKAERQVLIEEDALASFHQDVDALYSGNGSGPIQSLEESEQNHEGHMERLGPMAKLADRYTDIQNAAE